MLDDLLPGLSPGNISKLHSTLVEQRTTTHAGAVPAMKVYLDDTRLTPGGWVGCKCPDEVIALLKTGKVTHLSLDHDLGDNKRGTGYDVLLWIEKAVVQGDFHPPLLTINAVNPVHLATKMKRAIEVIRVRYDAIHNPQPDKYQKGD